MRIRGATTELEEAGLETEYMAESTASLQKKIKALTNVDGLGGFDIMADADNFKSTYEIILGISEVWEDMSDIDQAALLELLAGKRQGNALSAAITNMGDAVDAMKTSVESEGSAMEEHEKWMDSIAAKQQQFQAQYEAFANALLNSELVKFVYDAGTGFLGFLTDLVDTLGALPTVFAAVTPFFDKFQRLTITPYENQKSSTLFGLGITTKNGAKQLELKNDYELLDKYVAAVSKLGDGVEATQAKQKAWNKTIAQGSTQLKDSVEVSGDAVKAATAYKAATQSAGNAAKNAGIKAAAAAVGVQILNTALNMLISFGIGLAISAIGSALQDLINKQQDARDAAVEAGNAFNDTLESAEQYKEKIAELKKSLDSGTLSEEEALTARKNLLSIKQELIDFYGAEAESIDIVKMSSDEASDAIDNLSASIAANNLSRNSSAIDEAIEQMEKVREYWSGNGVAGAIGWTDTNPEVTKAIQDAVAKYDNASLSYKGTNKTGGTWMMLSVEANAEDAKETIEGLAEDFRRIKEEFSRQGIDIDEVFPSDDTFDEKFEKVLGNIDKVIDKYGENYENSIKWKIAAEPDYKSFENSIAGVQEEYAKFIDGDYDSQSIVGAYNSLFQKITVVRDQYGSLIFDSDDNGIQDYFDELVRQFEDFETYDPVQKIVDEMTSNFVGDLIPGTSAHFHAIDEFSTKTENIKENLRALSDEDLGIAYELMSIPNNGIVSWEQLNAEIGSYKNGTGDIISCSDKVRDSLKELWDSDDFSDAKEDLVEMAKTLDGITPDSIEELAEESDALAEILDMDGMNAQFLANVIQSVVDGGAGFDLITDGALKLNDALDGMTGKFDQVAEAKARYDAAMSVEEKDTDFKSYAEAFEELNAQFEAGTTNSNAFWAAAEFLFGSEQLATWGWSDGLDEIYTAMQNNKAVFSDADSAGAGFIERLNQMAQAGELVNEEGEQLLEIGKDSSGAYFFDIDPDNIEEIAKKMGITEEAALACLKALSMWGDINFYDLTEVSEVIEEIGLSCETASGKAINVDRLTEQLLTLGKTEKEIHDVIQALGEMDGVQLFTITEDVDGLTQSLQNLGLATEDGVTIKVDYEGLADLLSNLGYTKDEAEKLITKLGEADNISLANADGEVKDVSDALEYIDTLTFTEVESNLDGVANAVGDLDESSTDNVVSEIDEVGKAAEEAKAKIDNVVTSLYTLDGTTVTVTYDVKKKNSILGSIFGFAKGTKSAPNGEALVGEEGAELVQSGNHAYLAGQHGAEIVDLNEGDRVYTASETKSILHRSGKQLSGVIPAYKDGYDGRATTSGLRVETNKTGSTGTPYKVDVDVTADPTDLEDALKETLEAMEEELDEILGNFEHNIFLLEKNDGTPEEIIAIYKAMQKKVHEQAEAYRALGLDDTSDYIQELQKKWWDYQDTIDDMLHEIYKTAVEEHENAISLLEHQYDVLDGLRNSDGMSGNLEKQIEEQRKIQQLAHDEAQRLRELGVDENDDAIQECIDAWWDAEESIRDINSKIADNILDTFDDFIEYADDFELWADLDFTKVDYLKQKITAINKLFKDGVLTLKEYNELLRETQLDIYNEQKDALTEIIEKTMELVRQEAEDQIDALEDQIDKYQKIIELKKEALATSKDEESYEKEVAKRVAEIAKIQAKIAQLDRDDSREANAEKQQLAQELAELQEELADYQADYSYNAQVDALDKEADTFEDTKNKEIEKVEASVDTEEAVYKAAIARIDSDWNALYDDLIEWNKKYGDMIDGEDSITTAWQTAKAAAQEYGSVVAALDGINSSISYEEQVIASQKANEEAIHSIIKEMYENSQAHHSADTEGKARLNKRNLELGAQLAQYGITAIRGEDGVWYVDRIGGTKLYDKYKEYTYHTGGIVGEDALKSNEVLAKLEKGEVVMTENQFSGLFGRIKECVSGIVDGIVHGLTSSEPAVSEVVRSITNNDMDTDNSVTENGIVIQNEFNVQGMDEENMKQFAEYYSDYTIDKLISAKKRKGLKNSVGSHMLR